MEHFINKHKPLIFKECIQSDPVGIQLKMSKKCLEFTQIYIWRICYVLCCIAFGAWLMDAVNNYAKMWASSTVSLRNGDDGDRLVRFPVISLCKPADKDMEGGMQVNKGSNIGGMWKKVEPCKG